MAKEPIPDSVKHPLSLRADHADPCLYGGVAAIVGVVGILAGLVLLVLGAWLSAAILGGLGAVLLVGGFLVARRGD